MAEDDTSSEDWPEHTIPATHAERVASKIGTLIHKVFETYTQSTNKPDYLAKLEKGYFLGTKSATVAAFFYGKEAHP